jgi:hypothetical protein
MTIPRIYAVGSLRNMKSEDWNRKEQTVVLRSALGLYVDPGLVGDR